VKKDVEKSLPAKVFKKKKKKKKIFPKGPPIEKIFKKKKFFPPYKLS
jgi:hypothetical protein